MSSSIPSRKTCSCFCSEVWAPADVTSQACLPSYFPNNDSFLPTKDSDVKCQDNIFSTRYVYMYTQRGPYLKNKYGKQGLGPQGVVSLYNSMTVGKRSPGSMSCLSVRFLGRDLARAAPGTSQELGDAVGLSLRSQGGCTART